VNPGSVRTIAVVGGGVSGSLLALKLHAARPDFRLVVVESARRPGRGLAYGACSPRHLLNVPVSRMEVGLTPGFGAWLQANPRALAALPAALAESGGDIGAAFAPRSLFGDYLEERIAEALTSDPGSGLAVIRGEAVRVLAPPGRGLGLSDGRRLDADVIVLATGNLPPRAPRAPDPWFYDSPAFAPDPWASDAFEDLAPDDPVLFLGSGLTMVDIALELEARGHRGPMLAISRRGLVPATHAAGGRWPAFLEEGLPASPLRLMGLIRANVAAAGASGIPWQRVFDAARPAVPAVWRSWSLSQRRQFLRHVRTRWDVRRHRMAPRIAAALEALRASGRLEILAARPTAWRRVRCAGRPAVEAALAVRGGGGRRFVAARVLDCTGPRRDLADLGTPLLADLRDRGLAVADPLGLGLETADSALLDSAGRPSPWLYALGALTCPSWWEITAVPEICVQVDNLVAHLAQDGAQDGATAPAHPLSPEDFLDLGAGI